MSKLPKTRSGKILRGTIRKIVNKQEYRFPATIDDAATLDIIQSASDGWHAERDALKQKEKEMIEKKTVEHIKEHHHDEKK